MARLILALMLALCAVPAFAQTDDWPYRRGHDGVHLRILRDYYLPVDATATDPIVVIGGSATIDGRAERDVVVIGGTLRVGPRAVVRGDVVTMGGRAQIDRAARVSGHVEHVSIVGPDLGIAWARFGDDWWALAAFGATVLRLGLLLIVSLLLTIVAPGWILGISIRAASSGPSAFLGFLAQVLFVPGLVALVVSLLISVVGIPLLAGVPLLVGAFGLLWVAGFAGVAVRLGRHLRGRAASSSAAGDLLTGFAAISAVTILAHCIALGPGWMTPMAITAGVAGLAIEYLAWTVGLGAGIAALLDGRRTAPSLRLPVPAAAPTSI